MLVDPSGDRALYSVRDLQLPTCSSAGLCAACNTKKPSTSGDAVATAAAACPSMKQLTPTPLDLSTWRLSSFFLRVPSA